MDIALSLLVFTVFALVLGAFMLHRRGHYGRQMWLMLALAIVLSANVAILAVPNPKGESVAQVATKKKAPE